MQEHLRGANDYRNALVEVERHRRDSANAVIIRMRPEIAQLTEALETAQKNIDAAVSLVGKARAEARTRKAGSEHKDAIKEARKIRAGISAALKAARKEAFAAEDVREELKAIEEEANRKTKDAYAAAKCHWGTRLVVNEAAKVMNIDTVRLYE